MKAAILVCALAATALAAPYTRPIKLDPNLAPQVQVAEQAWRAAEAERDPNKQHERWERAALAFGEIDGAPVDAKIKRAAASAAILAWKNALNVDPRGRTAPLANAHNDGNPAPQPLSAREQNIVAAFDRYVTYADPTDPEVPAVLLLKARLYWRFDQLELAIPIFRSLIDRYPRHEVAGYAAQLLLDSYHRLRRYEQLLALADELATNTVFLRDRDDLAQTVALIRQNGKRKHAETLERAAQVSNDWDTYIAAATAYLDLYNANPASPSNDEVLYNAGVAFEQGRIVGEAIRMYGLLEKSYPNSRVAARATARMARIYGDIAMYGKAAEKLEQYTSRYGGEQDADDALSDAIHFRIAIGDRAKAIKDTELLLNMYGGKQPTKAANASWALIALYASEPAAAITHLQTYLRMFGAKGGPDRVMIAHARIGALLWHQSCPHVAIDGLCVKAQARVPRTCGAGSTRAITATQRDATTSKRAHAAFAQAMEEFERRPGATDDPAQRSYYAQARLAEADAALEAYLAVEFPRGLRFDPTTPAARTASLKRFAAWLDLKRKLGSAATRKYEAVLVVKDAASTITAASRFATISQTFASDLVTSALPRAASATMRTAYCDAIADVVAPLEARAIEAFAVCLAKSTELGWFTESSAYCERQLFELDPDEFPRTRELHSEPSFVAPVIVIEPPVRPGP